MSQTNEQNISKMKPITLGNMRGFPISNIQEILSPEQFSLFKKWIYGQTVGIYENEDFIYAHDFERFKAGLAPLD